MSNIVPLYIVPMMGSALPETTSMEASNPQIPEPSETWGESNINLFKLLTMGTFQINRKLI